MNWKKPTCTLLILTLILSTAMISVDADPQPPKLFVDPPEYTATRLGETFTIDIDISNIQDLLAFELKLGYNTTLLDVASASAHTFYAPISWWKTEVHEQDGYVWFAVNFTLAGEGNGTLAKITFEVTYAGSASCILDLYDTKLFNSGGGLIAHDLEDGNYRFVTLSITVATDKLTYLPGENVEVYGNATVDGSPHQGFVALEVDDAGDYGIVRRTLQPGPAPPPGNITIVDVFPSNMWGQPQENFMRGTLAYFNMTVRNNSTEWKNVAPTVNVYDGNNVSLGAPLDYIEIGPGISNFVSSINIPSWAYIGTGMVYASVFTDLPRVGGVPYCPEKSATFQIINSTQGATALETQGSVSSQSIGNYSLTFKLAPNASTGIYRVYASTLYQERSVMDNTLFGVKAIVVPDDYSTIQEAINAANSTHYAILVLPNIYNENVFINKTLTLVGVDPNNTIINGSGTETVVTVTADNVEINSFTIKNGGSFPSSGIALTNSSDGTISENIILDNYYGVHLNCSSQGNVIQGNTITSNGYGIMIDSSDNNDILDNTLSNNNHGIYLNRSNNANLRNNNMICNKYNFGVFGDLFSHFIHSIDTSNTVDGKPIIYWIDKHKSEIPSNAGYVAIVYSTEIAVRNLDLAKEVQGVLLAFTTDSLIERVKTINNEYGIYMVNSHNNTIVGTIVSNNTVGIYQSYCNGNIICHNNLINNTNQVDLHQSSNTWDDGGLYPCPICGNPQPKGNHWSDYTGLDNGTQTQAHNCPGDGVGDTDTPHLGVDRYPLMNPWTSVHNIAITKVTPILGSNATEFYPGWVINVNVTVKNGGDFTETSFTVTAYYDENPIETKTIANITLYPLKNTTIIFTWNTAEIISCRNYTISANATTVPGETYTDDNTSVYGKMYARLIGDVSGDGMVTGFDVLLATSLANFMRSVPPADPYADVNGDGMVTGFDVLVITSIENFMKACP